MFAREGHAATGSYLGMLAAHLQMLSQLCCSVYAPTLQEQLVGEMRWMEDEARRKWSIFLSRNDGVRGREKVPETWKTKA